MKYAEIEKESLEAHVELCSVRYRTLEEKLTNLEDRMDKVESYLVDIKNTLSNSENNQYKTIITIGTTILGVLITGVITLLIHFAK